MSVSRNAFYNLAGAAVPLALALITVPLYLDRIGEARYGLLAIVWLLLGYFGLFDLGLSRATANKIARLANDAPEARERIFWTACLLNAVLGVLGGVVLYWVAQPILQHWMNMSTELHQEAIRALPWIAAGVPVATLTAVFTGALEGMQQFRTVNLIQSFGTMCFQAVPLAAAYIFGPQLPIIIPTAVVVRILTTFPLFFATRSSIPLSSRPRLEPQCARELFAYGGWVTVTNLVGPILSTFDRFLVGVIVNASAVSYYVVPFQLASRTQIIPGALSRALFPHMSGLEAASSKRVALESTVTLASLTTPIIVIALIVFRPFLNFWVGRNFAAHAAPLGELLLIGAWINGLAYIPFVSLQAQGRPDIVAKFHLVEVVPFLLALWFGLQRFGVVAAAVAWTLRVSIDALLLFAAARLLSVRLMKPILPAALLVVAAWVSAQLLSAQPGSLRFWVGSLLILLTGVWALSVGSRLRRMLLQFFCKFGLSLLR